MKQVDMSARAVTARLKRIAQLRRLCLSLQKAKLPVKETVAERREQQTESPSDMRKPK